MGGGDQLFDCAGEMALRMAGHDWAATPLGPSTTWSHELRTSVALLLRSRYPMLLTWGGPLVMLYNDAFIPTLGAKHPHSLGGLLTEEFAEVWDDIGDMQRSVLAGGPATWAEDLPLTIERGSGPEQAYFTFSYSHVPDTDGPGGVLAVLTMTTAKVVAACRLALLNQLASVGTESHDPAEVVESVMAVLARAVDELHGGAFYEPADRTAPGAVHLVRRGSFGETGAEMFPESVRDSSHPLASAWAERRTVVEEPAGTDDAPSALRVALPVRGSDESGAVLVLNPHPLRPFDDDHRRFVTLLADQVGQLVATASERAREQARLEALAALDAAKTAFLSNVSHEFRTPLTLLLGPLEDVLGGRAETLDRSDVEVMHGSAHRLLRMVNGLLDVARIEAGGVHADLEPTDLAALTRDLLQPFDAAAARAGIAMESRLDPAIGIVTVDPGLWEKIVINLVSNALKFTLEGTVTVELVRVGHEARLRVTDTGVGIPETEIDLVFDRFHRVQHSDGRTIEGTGIGLALVFEATESLGGEVTVTSQAGVGSTFEVVLPLVEGGSAPEQRFVPHHAATSALARDLVPEVEEPAQASPPGVDSNRPVILVAEDNPAMRSRVARVLGQVGQVITAADGRRALETLRARRVDLVVTDVMMPDLDGLGLLKEIRADVLLSGTPVVLLSARAGPEAAASALEAGADDYVVKPFTTGELLARCRTTLELAEYRASEAAGRARSALLAGVSHDMQTPLAVITSTLELFTEDDMTASMRVHTAERAQARAAQLTQLVTQFLDWSRLSMNEPLPIRVRASNLREAADHVAADHSRARVDCDLTEVAVACDPQRTQQILHNLVDNAEKVARSSIVIRLDVAEAAVVARVLDDGPGVAPEVLTHLFEAFGPSTGTSGNGLGLYVSREAARAQGGDLVLESTGPEGTVFALTIPRDAR